MKKWQIVLLAVALCGCLIFGMTACKDVEGDDPADSTPGESQLQDDGTETEPGDDNTQESETQNGGNQGTESDTETETETETETKNNVSNEGHNDESGWGKVDPILP